MTCFGLMMWPKEKTTQITRFNTHTHTHVYTLNTYINECVYSVYNINECALLNLIRKGRKIVHNTRGTCASLNEAIISFDVANKKQMLYNLVTRHFCVLLIGLNNSCIYSCWIVLFFSSGDWARDSYQFPPPQQCAS